MGSWGIPATNSVLQSGAPKVYDKRSVVILTGEIIRSGIDFILTVKRNDRANDEIVLVPLSFDG